MSSGSSILRVSQESTSWDFLRFTVGFLLVISASLKLHQLLTMSTNGGDAWLMSPRVQWLAVGWESGLALWLWSGDRGKQCRRATIITFALFSAVSLFQALKGQRSCCCFGGISAAPWFVCAMDVGILIYLWRTQPNGGTRQIWTPTMRRVVSALAVACFMTGMGAAAWHQFTSSALRILDWPESALEASPGATAQWEFHIHNIGNENMRIARVTTSCECFSLRLPENHIVPRGSICGIARVQANRDSNMAGIIALSAQLQFDSASGSNTVVLVRDLNVAPVDQAANSSKRRTQ